MLRYMWFEYLYFGLIVIIDSICKLDIFCLFKYNLRFKMINVHSIYIHCIYILLVYIFFFQKNFCDVIIHCLGVLMVGELITLFRKVEIIYFRNK